MNKLLKCTSCNEYTMDEKHRCGGTAISSKPARFSPQDKYAKYRLLAKKRSGQL